MTLRQLYYPAATTTSISDAVLAYVQLLYVTRTGVVHVYTNNPAVLAAGGNYYTYIPGSGTIEFNPNNPFNQNESINVVYDPNP